MKNLRIVCAFTLASLSVLAVGCGSGSGSPPAIITYPSNALATTPYFFIQTTAGSSSVEQWPNATITGYANPNTLQCIPTSDPYCFPFVGNPYVYAPNENGIGAFRTNAGGQADFATDAITAQWNFYAADNGSTQCNGGTASYTTLTGLGTGAQVPLSCGANDAEMVATPSSCEFDNAVTPLIDTCPTTITLTFPPAIASSHTLTPQAAMTAAVYNSSGTNLAQSNVTAATTTSVVVPTPSTPGTTYLGIYNAAGSLVGVSEFTYTQINLPKPCPTAVTALARSGPSPDSIYCPPR
jgi:hypothetical protein